MYVCMSVYWQWLSGHVGLRTVQRGDMVVWRTATELSKRSFHIAAPAIWITLPDQLSSPSISKGQFRCGLKTHLIQQASENLSLRDYQTELNTSFHQSVNMHVVIQLTSYIKLFTHKRTLTQSCVYTMLMKVVTSHWSNWNAYIRCICTWSFNVANWRNALSHT